MKRRGFLRRSNGPSRPGDLIQGRIVAHRDGYGFVTPDAGGEDVFLPQAQMHTAMHGDHVAVWPGLRRQRGKGGGLFHKVLERGQQDVIGRLKPLHGQGFVIVPEDPRLLHQFEAGKIKNAKEGDLVVATITHYPEAWRPGRAEVSRILGNAEQNLDIDYAIASFGLSMVWPRAVRRELDSVEALEDTLPRTDLTAVPFVTIDGADAKDFDDAVHAEPAGKGWILRVAIADVSHYVRPGTALDVEARKRGTSVYFPNRVIPMLPPRLSEDLCSLRPQEERHVLVCEMRLGARGAMQDYQFYPARIRSRARLIYRDVHRAVFRNDAGAREQLGECVPELENLLALYRRLRAARKRRGALDIDNPECGFKFDADGQVVKAYPKTRLEAHQLIEECMIAANVAAACQLQRHKTPGLYRVHDLPEAEKVQTLRAFAASVGLDFSPRDPITPGDCAALLEQVRGTEFQLLIHRAVLRMQSLSVYAPKNIGHFGLALERYTHFTSPIRRYPDLAVHRAIRLTLQDTWGHGRPPTHQDMVDLGRHCSQTERRADEAVWDVEAACKCRLVSRHVGESWGGVISTVQQFGIFVELDDLYAEGLVHIKQLGRDYYHYEADTQVLRGERSGTTWQVGQRVQVRIKEVNVTNRQIKLVLDERSQE